jgi:hypothetical protein
MNRLHKDFDTLREWLVSRGFMLFVYTDSPNCVFWEEKEVHINSRMHIEKRLNVLIHECGHVLINSNRERTYALSKSANVSHFVKISKVKRVSVIAEEIEAWRRGERLASRLGIEIDLQKFDKFKTSCLMGYIHWAAEQDL